MEIKPGIYPNMSWKDYWSIPAISMSLLEYIDYSPAHLKEQIEHPRPRTAPLSVGTAAHWALFEPELFKKMVVVLEEGADGRSGAVKEIKKEAEANGKVVLKQSGYYTPKGDYVIGYRDIIAMSDAARNKDTIRELLKSPGYSECVVVWNDPVTGLLCKGKLDRYCEWRMWSVVADLKTARYAKPALWRYDIKRFNYHVRAAWYLDALYALEQMDRRWMWIVTEKRPPYESVVFEPSDKTLEKGREIYQRWIEKYSQCVEKDEWPGYADGIEPIDLPKPTITTE